MQGQDERVQLLLTFVLLMTLADSESSSRLSDEDRLYQTIMSSYLKAVKPRMISRQPLKVLFSIRLKQIVDLDERQQVLTTNVFIDQTWLDPALAWNRTQFPDVMSLRIPADLVWKPDTFLYNNADNRSTGFITGKFVQIRPDGHVTLPVPVRLKSSCVVKIAYFPFDYQLCRVRFGSWIYSQDHVDYISHAAVCVDVAAYVNNSEWELLSMTLDKSIQSRSRSSRFHPFLTMTVYLRRNTFFYLFNIIVPCTMLSILTLMTFFLPPTSGEKITLGLSVFLAFSMFMLLIAEEVPASSDAVPVIGIYLCVVMTMTSLSVIFAVFITNLYHRGHKLKPAPRWLSNACIHYLALPTCISRDVELLANSIALPEHNRFYLVHYKTKFPEFPFHDHYMAKLRRASKPIGQTVVDSPEDSSCHSYSFDHQSSASPDVTVSNGYSRGKRLGKRHSASESASFHLQVADEGEHDSCEVDVSDKRSCLESDTLANGMSQNFDSCAELQSNFDSDSDVPFANGGHSSHQSNGREFGRYTRAFENGIYQGGYVACCSVDDSMGECVTNSGLCNTASLKEVSVDVNRCIPPTFLGNNDGAALQSTSCHTAATSDHTDVIQSSNASQMKFQTPNITVDSRNSPSTFSQHKQAESTYCEPVVGEFRERTGFSNIGHYDSNTSPYSKRRDLIRERLRSYSKHRKHDKANVQDNAQRHNNAYGFSNDRRNSSQRSGAPDQRLTPAIKSGDTSVNKATTGRKTLQFDESTLSRECRKDCPQTTRLKNQECASFFDATIAKTPERAGSYYFPNSRSESPSGVANPQSVPCPPQYRVPGALDSTPSRTHRQASSSGTSPVCTETSCECCDNDEDVWVPRCGENEAEEDVWILRDDFLAPGVPASDFVNSSFRCTCSDENCASRIMYNNTPSPALSKPMPRRERYSSYSQRLSEQLMDHRSQVVLNKARLLVAEWQTIAAIVDRLLFFVVLIATVLAYLFLLLIVPAKHRLDLGSLNTTYLRSSSGYDC